VIFSCCHYVLKAAEGDVLLSHSTGEGLNNKLTRLGCLVQGSFGPKKVFLHMSGASRLKCVTSIRAGIVLKLLQVMPSGFDTAASRFLDD
jgi:hypothetical protein